MAYTQAEPFETYLRNALNACITAYVAKGYKTTTEHHVRLAKENLDAALIAYPQWAAKYQPNTEGKRR